MVSLGTHDETASHLERVQSLIWSFAADLRKHPCNQPFLRAKNPAVIYTRDDGRYSEIVTDDKEETRFQLNRRGM